MGRVLEAIFRRPLLLLILIMVLPVISLAVVYFQPRSYQAAATLWALHRYEVIGATGPETDPNSTPAETQATALSELLQARTFALTVANDTPLPSTLDAKVLADPQARDDGLYTEISTQVQVGAQGYNLFVISYVNKNPHLAQQVVQSVIKHFALQSQGFSVVEGQRLLEGLQTQLTNAKQEATKDATAEAKYIAAHSSQSKSDLLNDPQYGLLHAQTQQAQATLSNIQTKIAAISDEVNAQGTGSDGLFQVLDPATLPVHNVSRQKTILMGGGIGLGLALAACVLYIVIAVRLDRTVRTPLDLQKVTALPVVMQLPMLTGTTVPLLVESVSSGQMQ